MILNPLKGIDNIEFRASLEVLKKTLGKGEKIDLNDEFLDEEATLFYFENLDSTFFLSKDEIPVLFEIEIYNPKASLLDILPFNFKYSELKNELKKREIKFEEEKQDWGEKRIGIEELGIDFYFENDTLNCINLYLP